mmetsp:Transcript_26083/g.71752  ORF Transcript_26083/g.71752 Transcript_26083/m.71752 type:complete len:250 (-) Transcript_26083:60-809(-)
MTLPTRASTSHAGQACRRLAASLKAPAPPNPLTAANCPGCLPLNRRSHPSCRAHPAHTAGHVSMTSPASCQGSACRLPKSADRRAQASSTAPPSSAGRPPPPPRAAAGRPPRARPAATCATWAPAAWRLRGGPPAQAAQAAIWNDVRLLPLRPGCPARCCRQRLGGRRCCMRCSSHPMAPVARRAASPHMAAPPRHWPHGSHRLPVSRPVPLAVGGGGSWDNGQGRRQRGRPHCPWTPQRLPCLRAMLA